MKPRRLGSVIFAYIILTLAYFSAIMFIPDAVASGVAATAVDIALKLAFAAAAVITAVKLFSADFPKITAKPFVLSLFVTSAVCWCYIAFNFVTSIGEVDRDYTPLQTAHVIGVYALYCLAVGLVEEALNRRLLLDSLASVMPKYRALVLSALLFSLGHSVNFITTGLVWSTVAQLIYTFVFGLFFGAIYLRSRSFGTVVILHALFDFAGMIWEAFSSETADAAATDIAPIYILSYVRLFLPMLIAALFLIRPAKIPSINELWDRHEAIAPEREYNNEEKVTEQQAE